MLELNERFSFQDSSVAWGRIGDGDPVVLVHGFPWSSQSWRRIAPWLAQTHRVYFFDMLGCGLSEKTATQNVTESVQSDLLVALVAHWQLEKPQVIAHDFGGLAALRGHFVNGIQYSKLHLIDPVAVLPSGSPFYAHVAQYEAAFAGLPAYAHDALFGAYIQRAAHYKLRNESIELYASPWQGEVGQAAFYRQIAQSDTENIAQAQERYLKPNFDVHLIWGQNDSFIPVEQGEQLKEMLSANSMTIISDAAHIVQEDAPEALVGTLMRNV